MIKLNGEMIVAFCAICLVGMVVAEGWDMWVAWKAVKRKEES